MLDPRWYQAAATFVASGFEHVMLGPDHLLFLVCLILPFRRLDGYLVGVVTAFAVGHSITLIAAAYGTDAGGRWFAPLVEVLIAARSCSWRSRTCCGRNCSAAGPPAACSDWCMDSASRPCCIAAPVRRLEPAGLAARLQRRHRRRATARAGGGAADSRVAATMGAGLGARDRHHRRPVGRSRRAALAHRPH